MSDGVGPRPRRGLLPRALAARLTVLYALTFVACLVLSFALLWVSVRTVFDYRIAGDLEEDVEYLRAAYARDGDAGIEREIRREMAEGDTGELFIVLADATATVVAATDLSSWDGARIDPPDAARVLDGGISLARTHAFDGRDSEAATVLAAVGEDRVAWLAESYADRDEVMELMLVAFALTFTLAVPAASAIGWLASRRAARGIEAVSAAAGAIRDGDLARRAPVDDPVAEITSLAGSFNAMVDRNAKLLDDMRDMTDNIAHDLRSPLTRVRIIAETSLLGADPDAPATKAAEDIVSECDRLTRMISLALDVSEAEAGVSRATCRAVDLGAMARDVADLFDAAAEERGIALRCAAGDALVVDGDRTALERLCVNLVDNALKFSPPGSEVRLEARREGGTIALDVVDAGVGIASDDLPRVFDRYFRADHSRSGAGSGLGLAYVRAVARLHGGDVGADSAPGGPTRFRVTLPAADLRRPGGPSPPLRTRAS